MTADDVRIQENVAALGVRMLMQAALDPDITEFLGRDRYQRAAAAGRCTRYR